uniref:hypothetical protein n=1 Tax=Magnusiomyces fungicola TaxID=1734004 RepID=UPI001BEF5D9F|nr:hypothetical protein MFQ77_mgp01 [Saprochaete fungicola]QUV75107.1 hypothetical protein [Saprochaete fungicola]
MDSMDPIERRADQSRWRCWNTAGPGSFGLTEPDRTRVMNVAEPDRTRVIRVAHHASMTYSSSINMCETKETKSRGKSVHGTGWFQTATTCWSKLTEPDSAIRSYLSFPAEASCRNQSETGPRDCYAPANDTAPYPRLKS